MILFLRIISVVCVNICKIIYYFMYAYNIMSHDLSGDPVSIDLDRPREWNEAIRLHFYNQENELLLHGNYLNSQVHVCTQLVAFTYMALHCKYTHTHTYNHSKQAIIVNGDGIFLFISCLRSAFSVWGFSSRARPTVRGRRQWVNTILYTMSCIIAYLYTCTCVYTCTCTCSVKERTVSEYVIWCWFTYM